MSDVIWKFTLTPEVPISMPHGSTLLSVGEQAGTIVLWALCDPASPAVGRAVVVWPTGLPLERVRMANGLVFHVFDRGEL